jgi:hypothetical protein
MIMKRKSGLLNPSTPMVALNPNSGKIDAVASASKKYYVSRGLENTTINGRSVDITYLHIKEWIDCIRSGGTPICNIEHAFDEGITCLMAHKSYVEKRLVEWNPVNKNII